MSEWEEEEKKDLPTIQYYYLLNDVEYIHGVKAFSSAQIIYQVSCCAMSILINRWNAVGWENATW